MNTKDYIYCVVAIIVMVFFSLFIVAAGLGVEKPAPAETTAVERAVSFVEPPATKSDSSIEYHNRYFDTALEETTTKTEEKQAVAPEEPSVVYLGEFILTAYCPCVECCGEYALNRPRDENGNEIVYGASGRVLYPYYSVAVDPRVIPYGSHILINGHEYVAADCGGGIKGNRIDIYFATHEETYTIGVKYADVYLMR